MYLRPAFVETDTARIIALIRDNPFGLLVTAPAGGAGEMPEIAGSHIPFTVHADSWAGDGRRLSPVGASRGR